VANTAKVVEAGADEGQEVEDEEEVLLGPDGD